MFNRLFTLAIVVCAVFTRTNADEPDFPNVYNSEPETADYLSPEEALAKLKVPDGFTAQLFAAEPDVQNPIAGTVDHLGRVWIAENYTYAERSERFDLSLNDRVIVLEDSDGDGKADKRTVFMDSVKMLTGITVGQGGVWLMCPPQLLFVPDADGDLVPDGPPEIKLDGFHVAQENYHNFANGLSWGPDSWLYGRCGASCPGELGLPGSTDDERVPMRGGIWRFQPQLGIVEPLNQGTTNPWGHDWNSVGELFFINTVNGHLWHSIVGAHYVRPHTIDENPYSYEQIDMHADHWHFDTGKSWTDSRGGAANDYGGGHAHIGMMICHSESWPQVLHGKLMTINMHGRRINVEELERQGSGYVGLHEKDFVLSDDTWFRGMELLPLPDGNALILDWSDTGECHDHTGVHRTSGRIFKLSYNNASVTGNAAIDPNAIDTLAHLATEGTEWQARQARQLLRSAQLTGVDTAVAKELLHKALLEPSSTNQPLRALWALNSIDALSSEQLLSLLDSSTPSLRSWAIRFLTDSWALDCTDGSRPARTGEQEKAVIQKLQELAASEQTASVRLTLASTLQRLPLEARSAFAAALLSHTADADDHNLPLMVWYGLAPLGEQHSEELAGLLKDCHWPTTTKLVARRLAEDIDSAPAAVDQAIQIAVHRDAEFQRSFVEGLALGMAGKYRAAEPTHWESLAGKLAQTTDTDLSANLRELNILFGNGRAAEELKALVADGEQSLDVRRAALRSLVNARADGLQELCLSVIRQRFLNIDAAEGLALYKSPEIAESLVKNLRSFAQTDRPRVISILASRKPWANQLLDAIANGQIGREMINPYQAREIANHGDDALNQKLAEFWGQVRESPAERKQQMENLRKLLTGNFEADVAAGRALFDKNCAACHTMFGTGGKLGPDLTGAQRSNLDYLLENIVDPSAVVTKEFRATVVVLTDGRVLTGLATSQTEQTLTLATQNEVYQLPRDEIEEQRQSPVSTMPDGLLAQLSEQQIRDLFAYLQSKQQVAPRH